MNEELVLTVAREALLVTILVSTPILGASLLIGLLVSLFQATTQIHEMTLTFVPKILAVGLVLLLLGPWMLSTLLDFSASILGRLPQFVR
ncbi:MAG: flagellar biosynthesis protein FliQ [Firmicutes bacterium]|nr:flagellar biosynthesis protein FliQ [Bacillota bacterium]MCL5039511.1 flagellar biosynthesis protein FliQ [Bacillota bacterium]